MKRLVIIAFAFAAVFALSTNLSRAFNSDFPIGTEVEEFTLKDTDGAEKSYKDLAGEKATVVVFLSAQCPVVKAYNARIKQIAEDYKDKGVNFIGMNSNSTESLDWVRSHAKENYPFPMLIDTDNKIADKFVAGITPEVYVFNKDKKLVYHGAVDNDRSGENITNNFLRTALDEHLAGKAITKTETKAFGCTIKRKSA